MERKGGFIRKLEDALRGELPGEKSQTRMAPGIRLDNPHELSRNAAVLILLYPKHGKWHFVLVKRAVYPGVHSNQVGLPGGIHENGDPDLGATALRETREELGINDSSIRIIGQLSKLNIPVSGIEVAPFVGVYPELPTFRPDPAEVAYEIEVPLSDLMNPASRKEDIRTIYCKLVSVPFFSLGNEQVWGATAMMLSEFLDVLKQLENADPDHAVDPAREEGPGG